MRFNLFYIYAAQSTLAFFSHFRNYPCSLRLVVVFFLVLQTSHCPDFADLLYFLSWTGKRHRKEIVKADKIVTQSE